MQLNSQFKFPSFLKKKRLKEFCNCDSRKFFIEEVILGEVKYVSGEELSY